MLPAVTPLNGHCERGRSFAPPSGLPDPALRYGSGRSSFEKPNRWLFVAFGDHSSPPARGEIGCHLRLRQFPALQGKNLHRSNVRPRELRPWVFLRPIWAFLRTPLWPAGPGPSLWLRAFVIRKAKSLAFRRLRRPLLTPRKGGDRAFIATIASRQRCRRCGEAAARVISPREGEMSGRTEGGNVERCRQWNVEHRSQCNVEHRRQRNVEHRRQRTPAHEERS